MHPRGCAADEEPLDKEPASIAIELLRYPAGCEQQLCCYLIPRLSSSRIGVELVSERLVDSLCEGDENAPPDRMRRVIWPVISRFS